MTGADICNAVVGRDQDQARHRPDARQSRCDSGSEAASHYDNGVVLESELVVDCLGIAYCGRFRGAPGTAAVAAIIHQVDGAIGKRALEIVQVRSNVFAVTPEIE